MNNTNTLKNEGQNCLSKKFTKEEVETAVSVLKELADSYFNQTTDANKGFYSQCLAFKYNEEIRSAWINLESVLKEWK